MADAITVIVPTIGRPTLERTLRSFAADLEEEDGVVVIADGDLVHLELLVMDLAREFPNPTWVFAWEEHTGLWGHNLRNVALDKFVDTSHVWTIDDDDVAEPGAIPVLRTYMDCDWAILKMRFGPGHPANGIICWRYGILMHGDIGTPMVFARKSSARFGLHYSGDFDYVMALNQLYGEPVWGEEFIAHIRPEESDAAL